MLYVHPNRQQLWVLLICPLSVRPKIGINVSPRRGDAENAGLENVGPLKMQDWKRWDQIAGVENAGLENTGPYCKGGNRRTGKCRTRFAGVENAGQPSMEREMFTYA